MMDVDFESPTTFILTAERSMDAEGASRVGKEGLGDLKILNTSSQ